MRPDAIKPVHLENLAYTLEWFFLVRAGLEQCKKDGSGAVVVLGHSEYYPRFGFSPSARFGISCEYEVPEEVFIMVELQPGFLHGASGKVKYHAAFSNV
jgi:putative acetyltransferase